VLGIFLRSHILVFHDPQVYPVATQELGPVVLVGEYEADGSEWKFKFPLLMHPERLPAFGAQRTRFGSEAAALQWGQAQILAGNPFVQSMLLAVRAYRSGRSRGDYRDEVLSLQTAMESRLYATWQMLLVDQGLTRDQLAQKLSSDRPFRSVLLSILPKLLGLGGSWDSTDLKAPLGAYWQSVYLLRNRIVHAAYEPSSTEADKARSSYDGLRHFIRERLWARRREYPRSVVAVIGTDGMRARNWNDPSFEKRLRQLAAEPTPYFWPWDAAGRAKPSDA